MTKSNPLQDSLGFFDPLLDPAALVSESFPSYTASAVLPPAINAAAMVQTLYLTETGTSTPISVADINQGQLGDCYLLSSIGEIAMLRPSFISNMIHVNSNGTETVTLYKAANGSLPGWGTTAFKAASVTVTNAFPSYSVNNGATQDVLGNQKEIWPQVLESAYASLNGGYGAIGNGGSPMLAMEELTGHAATEVAAANFTLAMLQSASQAGSLIVMDTQNRSGLSNGLVGNHAYMFAGVTGTGAAAALKLLNPWGTNEPTPILMSQFSKNFAAVDIGHM